MPWVSRGDGHEMAQSRLYASNQRDTVYAMHVGVNIARYPVIFLGTGPGWTGSWNLGTGPGPVRSVSKFVDSVPELVGNRFQDEYPVPCQYREVGPIWLLGLWQLILDNLCESPEKCVRSLLTQEPNSCFWHQRHKHLTSLKTSLKIVHDARLQTKYGKKLQVLKTYTRLE